MRKLTILAAAFFVVTVMLLTVSANVQTSRAQGPVPCIFPTTIPGTGYAIDLKQSSASSFLGTQVTFNASIIGGNWGTTYGSVIFVDNLAQIGQVPVTSANTGNISFSTSKLTAGTHTIWAFYANNCIPDGDKIDGSIQGDWVSHKVFGRLNP
jgi:hypothetical protein